jgi:hypothetical protein
MEAKQTDPHSQKREREEAKRLPHMATAETAGACRNRETSSLGTHSRQRAREIRVRVKRGGERD